MENPRDGGGCWAAIYGVAQSWTRLKRLSSSSSSSSITEYKMTWGNKPRFKNHISSDYVAGLQLVIRSHISEAFSEIILQEVPLILSMQEWDFKYHLEPTGSSLFSTVQFSPSTVSDTLRPHGLQHARLPCPLPTIRACSNSYPSSW